MSENVGSLATPQHGLAPDGGQTALKIALVNSMGDSALAITEQRFLRLVQAALPGTPIDFRVVTLAAIPRGEMATARIARHYAKPEDLRASPPDAVIFSGAEPATDHLQQEVFWHGLTELFDWVRAASLPALFSCLAAHAAVLHFSGIQRHRLPQKAFGLFAQTLMTDHKLLRGMPEKFDIAHSRWNELRAADLRAGGYRILSSGPRTEVDMFTPEDGTPQLYLQGHPEYEVTALDGEYKRDVRRFNDGVTASRPAAPEQEGWGDRVFGGAPHAPRVSPETLKPPVNSLETITPLIRNWLGCRKEMVA